METQARMDAWPPRRARRPAAGLGRLAALLAVAAVVVLATSGVSVYADWLWFGELGYRGVFTTILAAQVALFLVGAIGFYAFFLLNVVVARRLANAYERHAASREEGIWAYVARVGARIGDHHA